jgi:hypothetical protein
MMRKNFEAVETKKEEEPTQVEVIKILSELPNDHLLYLKKINLNELLIILQKYANNPAINIHQEDCASYRAYHVLKENNERYCKEGMIPTKIGDVWEPKIHIKIGKVTGPTIIDLGSSLIATSSTFYEIFNLGPIKKAIVVFYLLILIPSML